MKRSDCCDVSSSNLLPRPSVHAVSTWIDLIGCLLFLLELKDSRDTPRAKVISGDFLSLCLPIQQSQAFHWFNIWQPGQAHMSYSVAHKLYLNFIKNKDKTWHHLHRPQTIGVRRFVSFPHSSGLRMTWQSLSKSQWSLLDQLS